MSRAIPVVAIVLALVSFAAAADESFTLNIPNRFDAQQQTAEVRVVLGLNAAPAGAQLVVNGSTTVALGATQTVNGDSVEFKSLPSNRVLIRYRPLSNFGADFCAGGGATDKSIPLRFVGAQDVVDYRLSSFVVGAPASECSNVSRRVADMPATIDPTGDGVAPALSATYLGRLPLDVVLVLDKSGSMADKPPGSGANAMVPSKAEILRAAANTFVANWRAIDAPIGSTNWSEDRIGIVFFDSTAAVQHPAGAVPPANVFVERGSSAVPGPWDALISTINTLSPGSSTSIGGGINAAMEQWMNDPAHDVNLVVVTDGMQNTAPLITADPNGILSLPAVAGLPAELRKRFIPLLDVAFGLPQQVDDELLRNVSLQTAGRSYVALDTSMMYDVFANTLVAVLKGNTASLATRFRATAVTPPAPRAVIVDNSVRRVLFSLQWAPPAAGVLDFDAYRPGSTTVAAPTRVDTLPQAKLKAFDLGSAQDVGTWHVRVRNAQRGEPTTNVRGVVPYTLNVFFLEGGLDYRFAIAPKQLRAEVSFGGKPLTKLPVGAIRARILRAPKTTEQVVRETYIDTIRKSPAGDPMTEMQRKIASLPSTAIPKFTPREIGRVTFAERARGVYSAELPSPAMTGDVYELVLDFDDPRTGHVHREERLEAPPAVRR